MASGPCFLYSLKLDKFIGVTRCLQERLGADVFNGGFMKLLDAIHPFERPRIVALYEEGMRLILHHLEGERSPALASLKFRILDENNQWLQGTIKIDVTGYDVTGRPDTLFGVFWINGKEQTTSPSPRTRHVWKRKRNKNEHQSSTGNTSVESTITPRELDVLNLITKGRCTKEIAHCLGISFHTVETHRKHLLSKFHAHNTAELIQTLMVKGIWSHP